MNDVGTSYIVNKERCPKCAEMGKDTRGDNLAVYDDGHKYCFGCGYYRSGNVSYVSNPAPPLERKGIARQACSLTLPGECSTDYTMDELNWVKQYELTRNDLLKYNVLHCNKGLLFPVFDDGLLGYQIRTFIEGWPKWFGKGNFKDIFNILPGKRTLVLTEDIVSAIKVNMAGHASMPVYGSTIKNRFERLYKLGYRDVIIWLDPDMHTKVIKEIRWAHGINTRIIFSDKDPKDYSLQEIVCKLKQ